MGRGISTNIDFNRYGQRSRRVENIFDKDQALSGSVDDNADRRYKYQAVIFDEIFATDEVSLSNVRCNISFYRRATTDMAAKKGIDGQKNKRKSVS